MADYNSGLPIRSEADGVDEKVIVKIVDGQAGGSNQMTVDSDKNAKVGVYGDNPAGADTALKLSELGHVNTDGDYDATNNSDPASNAIILHDRVASPTAADQNFRPTGVASTDGSNAYVLDVGIRDEAGNAFTTSNPLPVTLVDSEGTEVNNYLTSAAVAANASVNHDYTVTALKTLKLAQINCTASGKAKFEVQTETAVASGVFNTKFVQFNSTANPNCMFDVKELISVAAGVRVRVIRTNKDNQAQDLYSTISGHEI